MRLRPIAIIVASFLILASCGGGADEPPPVLDTAPGGDDGSVTSSTVTPPSEDNVIAFRGVPPPTLAIYVSEGGSGTTACREYESTSTPIEVVTGHTTDLETLGWTISDLVRTGYRHADPASFTATKDDRTLDARGDGDTATTSTYILCITGG